MNEVTSKAIYQLTFLSWQANWPSHSWDMGQGHGLRSHIGSNIPSTHIPLTAILSRGDKLLWQRTISNAFSWMKMIEFRFNFHWNLFQFTTTLVQVMAWRLFGAKPLPEPMLTQFIDAYMCHSTSHGWGQSSKPHSGSQRPYCMHVKWLTHSCRAPTCWPIFFPWEFPDIFSNFPEGT